MKYLVALFALLLFSPVMALNVSLSFGECFSDPVSNNTICAPLSILINQTSIYQQCIADSNSRIVDLNNTCNTRLVSLDQTVANLTLELTAEVKKVQGVNLSEAYANCIIGFNESKAEVAILAGESNKCQQESQNTVNKTQLDECQRSVAAGQQQLVTQNSNSTYYEVFTLLVGLAGSYYYFVYRKRPSSDRDIRGGRIGRSGESTGSGYNVPSLRDRAPLEEEETPKKPVKKGR